MKKIISVILAITLCLSVFCFAVLADGNHKAQCGNVSDQVGKTVAVPIKYSCDDGVYIIRFFIDYDVSALKYIKIENTLTDKFSHTVKEKNGRITLVADALNIANVSGDLDLFKVHFEILDSAKEGDYELKLSGEASLLKNNESGIAVEKADIEFLSGSVKVICNENGLTENANSDNTADSTVKGDDKSDIQSSTESAPSSEVISEVSTESNQETEIQSETETVDEDGQDIDGLSVVLIILAVVLVAASATFVFIKTKKVKKEV